jgi:hypothetical protein
VKIEKIRIPSTWTLTGTSRYSATDTWHGTAEFGLGVGPCGKTVVVLEIEYSTHGVTIHQVCSCTERKTFVYPWHTVTGRVEVTYG